jgi:succinate-semialdehyde dehydrogenase/glutarate-semialdehyde dehydrogenase
MLRSVNPATEATIATYDEHTPDQVEAALAAAASAQRAWRATDIAERLPLLTAIARELRADRESFARLITSEMGKPIAEARAEIDKSAWTLEHYAEHAGHYLAAQVVTSAATESTIVFEPLGVLLAVMPWNYPCWQFVRVLAPALAAGNGALLKHAGNVTGCAMRLAEILRRAGAPAGLCTSLLVGPDAVADLIADDRVAAVTLTG